MSKRFALINPNGGVENVILAEEILVEVWPHTWVELDENSAVSTGDVYDEETGEFTLATRLVFEPTEVMLITKDSFFKRLSFNEKLVLKQNDNESTKTAIEIYSEDMAAYSHVDLSNQGFIDMVTFIFENHPNLDEGRLEFILSPASENELL